MDKYTSEELEELIPLINEMHEHKSNFKRELTKEKVLEICDFLQDENLKQDIRNSWSVSEEKIYEVLSSVAKKIDVKDIKDSIDKTNNQMYKYFDKDIQQQYFADVMQNLIANYRENRRDIGNFLKYTHEDVQNENHKYLLDITNTCIQQNGIIEFGEIWKEIKPILQKKCIAEVFSQIQENNENSYLSHLWIYSDKQVQIENEELFLTVIQNTNIKCNVFAKTEKSIQRKYKELIPTILEENKKDGSRVADLWKSLDEDLQDENENKLLEIFDILLQNQKRSISVPGIWAVTNVKFQEKNAETLFYRVLEICEKNNDDFGYRSRWNDSSDVVRKKCLETLKCKKAYETYCELKKYNEEIDTTLYLKTMNEDVLKMFDIKDLVRITNDFNVQKKINYCMQNPVYKKVLQNIYENNVNWVMEFESVLNNIGEYESLLENIDSKQLEDGDVEKLIHILSQSKNFFEVENTQQLRNFYDIRKEICVKILNGDTQGVPESILSMEENDRKKFAVLEGVYGIDLNEAINLTKKYGKDIEKIAIDEKNEVVVKTILGMKRILESENIDEHYLENLQLMQNSEKLVTQDFEAECIRLYERLYDKSLYKLSDEDKTKTVEYEGEKIDVFEISPEKQFNLMVRVEGAYDAEYQEPENFLDSLYSTRTMYHGNCKSFIGQDLMAIARPKGPIFVYNECQENSLLLSAPWDIVSTWANTKFSTASTKWNYGNGIEYRIPEEQINNTRHNHNEMVSERLIWDDESGQFKKDKPQCVMYIIEPAKDNEQKDNWERIEADDRWRMTKKVAKQLGVPILVLDREKIAEKEYERVMDMKETFLGLKENEKGIPEEQLLEQLMVKLENNVVGCRFLEPNKYFSNEKKVEIIKSVVGKIKSLEYDDFERYYKLVDKMETIFKSEDEKRFANTGKEVHKEPFYQVNGEALSNLKETAQKNMVDTELKNPENIGKIIRGISKTHFYDNNKQHSIEHIQKVILFSDILARNEHLSKQDTDILLAAAAFHDSGREGGMDGNISHALASVQKVEEYLTQNPQNEFGITQENLPIIKTAIHYHEHREKEKGKLDLAKLKSLCNKYGVRVEEFERATKISELLKDADALDRARFARRGSLDKDFLRSDTAKKPGMISFAKKINSEVAKTILKENYGKTEKDFKTQNSVEELRNTRIASPKKEKHVELLDLYKHFNIEKTDVTREYNRLESELENQKAKANEER